MSRDRGIEMGIGIGGRDNRKESSFRGNQILGDQRTGATDVSVSFFFGREGVIWRGK